MDPNTSRSPSPKKLKVDLNDSFYDSEDDELLNQACSTAGPLLDISKQTPEPKKLAQRTPSSSAAKSRPLMHSTPVEFSLKGKPLNSPFARGVSTPEPADELIMSTSKPFFRLAIERKEQEDAIKALTDENTVIKEERDDLRGKVIYLEQCIKTKDKEIHDMVMQLADWRKKCNEIEAQLRDSQNKQSDEIIQLKTQIRFLEEGRKAEAFSTSSEFKEQRDENGKIVMTSPEQKDELKMLTPVHNIQTLKPRMTSASASKLNFSGNL